MSLSLACCVQKAGVSTANNDILVFLVGLGESGAESGLGISVKGKTSVSNSCFSDLGLYVKSILDGGAAAKVYTSACLLYHKLEIWGRAQREAARGVRKQALINF